MTVMLQHCHISTNGSDNNEINGRRAIKKQGLGRCVKMQRQTLKENKTERKKP